MRARKRKFLPSEAGFEPGNKPAAVTDEQKAVRLVEDHILQNRADVEELEDGDVYLVSYARHNGTWVCWVGTVLNDQRLYQVYGHAAGLSATLRTFEEIETKVIPS